MGHSSNGGFLSDKALHTIVLAIAIALISNGVVVWRDQAVLTEKIHSLQDDMKELKWQMARLRWRTKFTSDGENKTRTLTIPDLRRDP